MRFIYKSVFLALAITLAPIAGAVESAQPGKSLPFTREENEDGSRWVWFVMSQANLNYEYVMAKDLPDSGIFLEVNEPQAGDVVWWPGYIAIIDPEKKSYMTAEGYRPYKAVENLFGEPKYFRFIKRKNP